MKYRNLAMTKTILPRPSLIRVLMRILLCWDLHSLFLGRFFLKLVLEINFMFIFFCQVISLTYYHCCYITPQARNSQNEFISSRQQQTKGHKWKHQSSLIIIMILPTKFYIDWAIRTEVMWLGHFTTPSPPAGIGVPETPVLIGLNLIHLIKF